MSSRVYLVLGAAVLALVGGGTAVGSATRPADDFAAVASEVTAVPVDRASVEQQSVPQGRTSSAKLKRVDTIELDAETISLARSDAHSVTVLSLRRGDDTVRTLTRLLGTPAKTQTAEGDGGRCLPASTTYTWGGALRIAELAQPSPLGNALEVRVLRPEVVSRKGATVELTGPDGVQVGDDVRDRIRAASAEHKDFLGSRSDPAWQVLLGEGWPSDRAGAGTNGVSALTDDTEVTVIGTPMPVHDSSHC